MSDEMINALSSEELRDELYEKAAQEQEEFLVNLKSLPPEEIINHCYEKAIRDDILMSFESDYLDDEEMRMLLKCGDVLGSCYNDWLSTDYTYMDMIRDTVSDFANGLVKSCAN